MVASRMMLKNSGSGIVFRAWRRRMSAGNETRLASRYRFAVAFEAIWLQRTDSLENALGRQIDDCLGAFSQLRAEFKEAAMQLNEVLDDGQSEACAALGCLVGERSLPEGLHDFRDFFLGDAGAGVADRQQLAAVGRPPDGDVDLAAAWSEFKGVRHQVEANLPHSPRIGPDMGKVGCAVLYDPQAFLLGAQIKQALAVVGDILEP